MFGKIENQSHNVLFISFVNSDSMIEISALLAEDGCTVDLFSTEKSTVQGNNNYRNSIVASTVENEFINQLFKYMSDHNLEYQWIIPADPEIGNLLNNWTESEELFQKILPASIYKTAFYWGHIPAFSKFKKDFRMNPEIN